MSKKKTLELKFERMIPAAPREVYDAWLNPKFKGSIWTMAKKFILNAKVEGLFFWQVGDVAHYGRFTEMKRGSRIQYTWMSPYTLGLESTVAITFAKHKVGTLMTLVHAGLPNTKEGQAHNDGWDQCLAPFVKHFGQPSRR